MTPLTFVPHDSVRDLLFKLVATQAGSQVPLNGDTELDLVRKWLLNKAGYPAPSYGDEIIDLLRKVLTGQAGAQTALSNDREDDLWRKIALNLGGQPRTNDEKRDLLVSILGNDGEEEEEPPAFVAETAVFDGTDSMRLVSSGPTGLADGPAFTWSGWVDFTAGDGMSQFLFAIGTSGGTNRFFIHKQADNTIRVVGATSAAATILLIATTSTIVAAAGWTHLYVCANLASAGSARIYFNGVSQTLTETTFTNGDIDFVSTSARYTVGGNSATTPATLLSGATAEFWFDDTYINDPTLFITGGKPKDLGADGSTPKGGTKPVFYFSRAGSGNTWATDSANGSNMTVTGALGSTTSP